MTSVTIQLPDELPSSLHRSPIELEKDIKLAAKRRGLVPAARPVIDGLIANGLYLSEEIVDRALALVGE